MEKNAQAAKAVRPTPRALAPIASRGSALALHPRYDCEDRWDDTPSPGNGGIR
jgi:hypothetical protein